MADVALEGNIQMHEDEKEAARAWRGAPSRREMKDAASHSSSTVRRSINRFGEDGGGFVGKREGGGLVSWENAGQLAGQGSWLASRLAGWLASWLASWAC